MARKKCFGLQCCSLGLGRRGRVAPAKAAAQGDSGEEEAGFTPACTCKAFCQTGSCKHLPPALLPGFVADAPDTASDGESSIQVNLSGSCPVQVPVRPASLREGPASMLTVSSKPEHPELDLQTLAFELRFVRVIGKGASGAIVLHGVMAPSSQQTEMQQEAARVEGAPSSEQVVSEAQEAIKAEGDSSAEHVIGGVGDVDARDVADGFQLNLFSGWKEVPCAAKVLPLGPGTFPDMIEDFGSEVKIMRKLKHPCLVRFFGAGRIPAPEMLGPQPGSGADLPQAYVLCIELCDLALEKAVQYRGRHATPFGSEELGPALSQVVAGLAYLHRKRVLHRDLKSANVFLKCKSPAGGKNLPAQPLTTFTAKLGDFGGCAAASRAQTPVFTPQWMAPEAMRMEGYGRPADIWSFGMLMYELLELSIPFGEDITMPQLEEEIGAGRAPLLTKEKGAEERAPAMVDLMRRCLAAAPEDRPTATELGGLIEKAGWAFDEGTACFTL